MTNQVIIANQTIELPALSFPGGLDKSVANRTSKSMAQATSARETVLAALKTGIEKMSNPAAQVAVAKALQAVLAEKTNAHYWCNTSADDAEQDIFTSVQMRMRRR